MDHQQRLKDLAVSESGFVFDPYTGSSFNTNATGCVILEGLRDGLERPAILARVEDEFDADGSDLDRDLDEFVFLLRENGLLPSGFNL